MVMYPLFLALGVPFILTATRIRICIRLADSLKGCCHSTSRDEGVSSPYSPSNAHGDSSSRAITSVPIASDFSSARASSYYPAISQGARSRDLGLSQQFNSPLKRHSWTSQRRWTRLELNKEREEFFDTRVTGRAEVWASLKMIVALMVEGDIPMAQGILDAAGVTVPTGDLVNGAYDEIGNLYQIPEYIISDPTNLVGISQEVIAKAETVDGETDEDMERRREEKGKGVLKIGETIRVKTRLSDRGGPDVIVTIGKDQTVRALIRRIQDEAHVTERGKVKIAYLGKILKDNETLQAQGWREGHVINALVFP